MSQEVFENIYDNNLWGFGSGEGSTIEYTKEYVIFLQNFIKNNNIKTILDYGCGDWQFSKKIKWEELVDSYLGVDVVPSVIHANQKAYSNNIVFFEHITPSSSFLYKKYDLVICKDVLQHLSNNHVINTINILRRMSKGILITNDLSEDDNVDILDGEWRPINFNKAPFNLKTKEVFEFKSYNKKTIYIK